MTTPPAPPAAEPVNLPFERVPQHGSDPGFGPVPPESNVQHIRQTPCCGEFQTCRQPCVPLVDSLRNALAAERARADEMASIASNRGMAIDYWKGKATAAEALATRLAHERDGFRKAWNQAQEYADKLDAAEARAAELEHDIARHVEICAEEATRAAELARALEICVGALMTAEKFRNHYNGPDYGFAEAEQTARAALRRPDA